MTKKAIRWCFAVCAVVALFGAHNACATASIKKTRLIGSMAPDFTLETTQGDKVSLRDLRGKGLLLFFFTTWCPYCLEKFPELIRDYPMMREKNIAFLSIDAGETRAKVRAFAEKQKLPFPVLLDMNTLVAEAYGVVGVPTVVLVSPRGDVVWSGYEIPDNYCELLEP